LNAENDIPYPSLDSVGANNLDLPQIRSVTEAREGGVTACTIRCTIEWLCGWAGPPLIMSGGPGGMIHSTGHLPKGELLRPCRASSGGPRIAAVQANGRHREADPARLAVGAFRAGI